MAFADRVWETSTTTGTGPLTLLGAQTGYRTFLSAFGAGGSCYYVIAAGAQWEVGLGSISAGSVLTRTTVFSSSDGTATVDFTGGVKNVYCAIPSKALEGVLLSGASSPVFKSGGTTSETGFQVSDGTDLAAIFNFGFKTAEANRNAGSTGAGGGVYKTYVLEEGSSADKIRLAETTVNYAIGYCSYCSYCNYCTHCSYCTCFTTC